MIEVEPRPKRGVLPPEQILHSIKQEYKRIQKRKHLDGGYLQSECSYSPESPSQSSSMHISSMSGELHSHSPLKAYRGFREQ